LEKKIKILIYQDYQVKMASNNNTITIDMIRNASDWNLSTCEKYKIKFEVNKQMFIDRLFNQIDLDDEINIHRSFINKFSCDPNYSKSNEDFKKALDMLKKVIVSKSERIKEKKNIKRIGTRQRQRIIKKNQDEKWVNLMVESFLLGRKFKSREEMMRSKETNMNQNIAYFVKNPKNAVYIKDLRFSAEPDFECLATNSKYYLLIENKIQSKNTCNSQYQIAAELISRAQMCKHLEIEKPDIYLIRFRDQLVQFFKLEYNENYIHNLSHGFIDVKDEIIIYQYLKKDLNLFREEDLKKILTFLTNMYNLISE
jgi:hypothetical protein